MHGLVPTDLLHLENRRTARGALGQKAGTQRMPRELPLVEPNLARRGLDQPRDRPIAHSFRR